jgi:hypothetical protein
VSWRTSAAAICGASAAVVSPTQWEREVGENMRESRHVPIEIALETRNMFNIVLSTEKLGGTEAPYQKCISERNPNTSKPHLTSFLQRVFSPHREKFDNSIHKNVRMLRAWRMAWTLFEVPPLTEQARTWLRF